MAILKIKNSRGKYHDIAAKNDVLGYIIRPDKAQYYGGIGVEAECPAESMELISERFGKANGVQLRHYIISFSPEELRSPEVADQIARAVTAYIGRTYQVVYAVHTDEPHINIHFVFNTVSYVDGHRYRGTYKEFHQEKSIIKAILRRHQIYELTYIPSNA